MSPHQRSLPDGVQEEEGVLMTVRGAEFGATDNRNNEGKHRDPGKVEKKMSCSLENESLIGKASG